MHCTRTHASKNSFLLMELKIWLLPISTKWRSLNCRDRVEATMYQYKYINSWSQYKIFTSKNFSAVNSTAFIRKFPIPYDWARFIEPVINDNLSFNDYYHGKQCFIANQNQECHFICHWMTSCHWWQVLWNGPPIIDRHMRKGREKSSQSTDEGCTVDS